MFYENLVRLCAEKNTTPTTVAKACGLSSVAPVYWKNGSTPRDATLRKLADYFNVTVNDLLSDPEAPDPDKVQFKEPGGKIPVLASVGAGIPRENICTFDQDDPDSWEEISKLAASTGKYYALRIRGNSMAPRIKHGDIVIVHMQSRYEDGDIVIATIEGSEGVCKQLEFLDDGIALHSFNPAYKPMIYTREQMHDLTVRLMGKCVEVRGKL